MSNKISDEISTYSRQYPLYAVKDEYKDAVSSDVPFRVAPEPLKLRYSDQEVIELGPAICNYVNAVMELYNINEDANRLLNRGKPSWMSTWREPAYLFIRPDLILTKDGFSICEIETSPFGLALADMVNRAYIDNGFDTLVPKDKLREYVQKQLQTSGTLAFSNKVKANVGQLHYLAEKIFSADNKAWDARLIDDDFSITDEAVYRAFYLSEVLSDENICQMVENTDKESFVPSITPQIEEKAILSFIWDKRFERFLKSHLGLGNFYFLKHLIPPTWIVGEEEHFVLGLPEGVSTSLGLIDLPESKRKFVLKQSGFSDFSSWGRGVTFLHKATRKDRELRLLEAQNSETLYIVQHFEEGIEKKISYYGNDGNIATMMAKIRLCPFYGFMDNSGDLISAVATCCEKTDYIHGMTSGVNTAVIIS